MENHGGLIALNMTTAELVSALQTEIILELYGVPGPDGTVLTLLCIGDRSKDQVVDKFDRSTFLPIMSAW
jgi:hypothetical protein